MSIIFIKKDLIEKVQKCCFARARVLSSILKYLDKILHLIRVIKILSRKINFK